MIYFLSFQAPEIPSEILIDKYKLQDLCAETAKLKSQGAMESIPSEKVVKLLNILELNIRDGSKVCPLPTSAEEEDEVRVLCPKYQINTALLSNYSGLDYNLSHL